MPCGSILDFLRENFVSSVYSLRGSKHTVSDGELYFNSLLLTIPEKNSSRC